MPSTHSKLYFFITLTITILGVFTVYEIIRTTEISTTQAKVPLISAETYEVPLTGTEPSLGNPGAENMVILFADFGSRASQDAFSTLKSFIEQHPDQFRLIWKDAPQPTLFTRNSIRAHVGGACAANQKNFWPFAERVFSSRDNLKDENLKKVAEGLNLNIPTWTACFTATSTEEGVTTANQGYRQAGVVKAPTLFINGKKINLVKEIELEDILESLIAQ